MNFYLHTIISFFGLFQTFSMVRLIYGSSDWNKFLPVILAFTDTRTFVAHINRIVICKRSKDPQTTIQIILSSFFLFFPDHSIIWSYMQKKSTFGVSLGLMLISFIPSSPSLNHLREKKKGKKSNTRNYTFIPRYWCHTANQSLEFRKKKTMADPRAN
jgi:hypothetical protein